MSSPSVVTLFPPSARSTPASNPIGGPAAAGDVAAGLPVENLPPLVEPTGFDEPAPPEPAGHRPPRRSFLAPIAPAPAAAVEAPAGPARSHPVVPAVVAPESLISEPVAPTMAGFEESAPLAAPAPAEPSTPGKPVAAAFRSGLHRLRGRIAAASPLPAGNWRAIGIGAAIVLMIALVYVAGVGRFAGSRQTPESPPPPSDPAARFAYFQTAANTGDTSAELQLAILYAKGEGVERDYPSAARWFRAAADHGSPRAQYDLGVMYERGRGVPVDLAEAARWYRKAAEAKHPLAQYNLAVCYTKGQGVREDLPEAALWYRRAAGQGVIQAMINLGMMYEKGEGMAASPADAYAWYFSAGQRGSQPAAQRAQDVFATLAKLDQIRAEALASDVSASIHDPERGQPR